jgi:hypothetical protein
MPPIRSVLNMCEEHLKVKWFSFNTGSSRCCEALYSKIEYALQGVQHKSPQCVTC